MTTKEKERRQEPFRSFEELERELMPKRAEARRTEQNENELRDRSLEIVRRSVANALRVKGRETHA